MNPNDTNDTQNKVAPTQGDSGVVGGTDPAPVPPAEPQAAPDPMEPTGGAEETPVETPANPVGDVSAPTGPSAAMTDEPQEEA